ncbi:hypothetical protein KKI19_00685 [Patescibacteria group bacterium]|nr:hypothetical protein [Patescibacteria group bacterium]
MNKKVWLKVILILVTALLVVLLFSVFGIRKRVDIAQTSGDYLYQIYEDRKVGQTFVANKDNLNIIVLDLRNAMLKNEQPIVFHLREMGTDRDLREIQISGLNVGDPGSVRFQFEPISDSAGKSYYFYLESPSSTVFDAVEIFHSPKDVYSEGEMILNDKSAVGELRFVSYYYPGSKKNVIRETIKDFTSRLFTDKGFIISYLFLLFLTFSLSLVI